MKKNTLYIVLIMLLATVNTAWGQRFYAPPEGQTPGQIGTEIPGTGAQISLADAKAKIGDTGYLTLEEAIEAATDGQTITLLQDIDVTAQVEIDKQVTLDLNGNTIAYTGTKTLASGVIMVLRGGDLTVTDSSDPSTGAINSGNKAYAAIALTKAGETSTDAAKLTVNGGTLTGYYYAITGNGSRHNTVINITGGVIQGTCAGDSYGIYHPQEGTLNISGGTFTADCAAVELRSGTLNISGGIFTTTATTYSCNPNGSGTTTVGAAVAIAQHTTNKPIEATITGGTFNASGNAKKLSIANPQKNTFNNVSVAGSTNLIGESVEIPEGFEWVDEGNGTSSLKPIVIAKIGETEYATLTAAIAAATEGQTIILLKDIETADSTDINKGVTIDGAGHSIICNATTVTDATTQYLNSKAALNFKNITTATTVNIQNLSVKGFAYVLNAPYDVKNLTVNMTGNDNTSYGRALVNNWGTNNEFYLEGVKFKGLNNEGGSANEEFAVIVDNEDATSCVYSLSGCTITANVNTENTYAKEDLITLKGPGAIAMIVDGTTFTPDDTDDDRMTFFRNAEQLLATTGNKLYLDDDAKAAYEALYILPSQNLEVGDAKEDVNGKQLWPVKYVEPAVAVSTPAATEYYSTLDKAFTSALIANEANIQLYADVTLTSDIDLTSKISEGEYLCITLDSHNLTFGEKKITLGKMAAVNVVGGSTGVLDGLFVASDDETVIVGTILDTDKTYTAAQTKWTNTTIEIEMAEMFENVFTSTELANGDVIDLKTDVTLTQNLASNLADGKSFTLNFGDNTVTKSDYSVSLNTNTTAYTDKRTDIFTAAATGYVINEQKTATGYAYTPMNLNDAVAKIGDIYYATLANAIDFVQAGETIDVLKDIETATPTEVNKSGFTINGNVNGNGNDHSIICNDPTVTDPKAGYLNNKGALYFTAPGAVSIKNLSMKGFAYAVDVETDDAAITMTGGKVYGRAALNVHGNNNSFTFSGVEVHGMNNEDASGNEAFAAFVLDSDANNNELNIENCPVIATIANDNGYNTEKYIELRGANNKVFISGSNSSYSCTPAEIGGFTNNTEDLSNDKVFFDESAKAKFNPLFASISDLQISDIESADYEGYYPLTNTVAVVVLTNALNYPEEKFMFSTIEQAFQSDKFDPTMGTELKLLGNVTLAADFTPTMAQSDMFTINLNGKTLNGGSYHINLAPGAIVEVIGGATDATKAIFAATGATTTIVATDALNDDDEIIGVDYTAANCLFDDVATLFNETVIGDGMIDNNSVIDLVTDIALTSNINVGSYLTSGQSFKLNFGNYNFTGGKNFLLPDGVSVTTDKQTELFKAATDGHFVLETANGNGTYTYSVSADVPATAVVLNENTGIYYTTLQAATAAANEGNVIVLLADITTDEQVDITKSMTIKSKEGNTYVVSSGANSNEYINRLPLFNLTGIAEGSEVNIQDVNIDGFAYAVNVENKVKGVTLNMSSTNGNRNITGRAAINNWGSDNTFNVDGYDIYAFNNENGNYEYFAAFVDNKSNAGDEKQYEAKNNTYNISNVMVIATVAEDASALATSKFIDLRGSDAKVNLVNTRYSFDDADDDDDDDDKRYGFTNDDYVNLLVSSNKVWFDENAKRNFAALIGVYDGLSIAENADETGLWPLVNINGVVRLTPDPINAVDVYYHFSSLEEAIASSYFKPKAQIDLLGDVTVTEDITLPASFVAKDEDTDRFRLNLVEEIDDNPNNNVTHTITVAEGKGIVIDPLINVVVLGGADGTVDNIFKVSDEKTVICTQVDGTEKTYTAANVKFYSADILTEMYYMFDDLFTDDVLAETDDVITLMTNVAIANDRDMLLASGKKMTINFGVDNDNDYDITGANLLLADGASIITNRQTDIIEAKTNGHFVLETANGDETYTYTVSATAPSVDDDYVARIDNRYFTTLQDATNVAQDGETVVLLKDITTEQPVNITTAITLNGANKQVTSTANPAFKVSGNGDVTINKLKVKATEGDAIKVINDYAGKLTLNNDTITTSRRGIDVQSIADGFALTVNSSLIQSTVEYPTSEYVNSSNNANSPGRGINFSNDAISADVLITKSTIQGFAYGVNVSDNSGKLNVTIEDGTFYGRAVVNNWGNGSTFNINNMTVNGLNNEESNGSSTIDPEYFATIVDNYTEGNGEANYNNYNINNSTFTAKVADNASDAATEKFIELRGNSARVKITGNTTYTYTGSDAARGGFTNDEFVQNLVEGNKVWFDETAKANFTPIVDAYNNETYGNIGIMDNVDETNLYPLGYKHATVRLEITENNVVSKYYYESLDKALENNQINDDAQDIQIIVLENTTLNKNHVIDTPFTLNFDNNDITVTASNDAKLLLNPSISVNVFGTETDYTSLFGVPEEYQGKMKVFRTKNDDNDYTYTAGNVFYDNYYSYTNFDRLFDPEAGEALTPTNLTSAPHDYGYVRLEMDITLEESLTSPMGGTEEHPDSLFINFNGKTLDPNGNAIVLKPNTEVFVNGNAENLFSSADPEYTVMYDSNVTATHADENGEDIAFTKKYYLMKDGLAVTVAPATYCGHEQVPTIEVKKRVESTTTPGTYEWETLEAGTDYTWSLVPKENEDDYIAAKTYANSVVIEGKTFQGRRKADFIINPRNINDVTVTGNEQPSRDNGYTRELIANAIAAEYGCIITEHKKDATTVMTYTLKKKGATTEKPDYVVTVDLAEGQRIYEIGTYKDLITVAALEGTEGTQNFVGSRKLDFVILPGDAIDIANVLITSKAVYNSLTQIPSYESIEVTYKNGYNKVVLDPNQFKIEIHGMQHDYVDAKTYTNAITLKGTGKVGTTNSLKFYGTINADYVIMPRDLADTDFEDDKVQVVLEKNKDMDWTGEDLTNEIKIGDIAGANNIYFYMKVQTGDTYNGYRYVLTNDATTGKYDYSYTVEPSPMKDPGEYKVIFTGRGNFTGMTEVKINVLKDINAADAEIALQVIPAVNETNYASGSGLTANDLKDVNITDGDATLSNGTHYTIALSTDPIKQEGKYTATITGKAPYYKGEKTVDFPAVYEYYTYAAANVDGNKFGIHVTSGKDKTANVGAMDNKAVNPSTQGLIINPTKNVTLTGVDEPVALTIAGIDDNAFNGGNALRYVDASQLDDYEPSSLSRNADGPFNGISKQAIVYLDGDDVIGENYVYETSAGDFRCDEFKIYDDFDGNQKGFDGEGQGSHSWEIINIHEFTAKTLTNTRYFNAGQHYTTLLPYDLPLPETLKAYNLTAASDGIFGFREIEEDALTSFMPYVLIPSAAGNLLSTTDAVVKVTATANRGFYPLRDNLHRQTTQIAKSGYVLYGSMIYMGHTSTTPIIEGTYIMQSGNQWKKIAPNSTYDGACILPMRAYILKLNDGIDGHSREFMSAKFIDAVEKTATDMAGDDWSDAEVYDLQGRKVDTTKSSMRKGVYIVNGQKRIRK